MSLHAGLPASLASVAAMVLCCVLFTWTKSAFAQGTVFTYQGRLVDAGKPANGSYDLQFRLADAATGGNYVGPTLTNAAVTASSGLFAVALDFGATVLDGSARWLEISVRTNGSTGSYTVLSPRQPITAAPYAVQALKAGTASSYTGMVMDGQLSGNIARLNGSNVFSGTVQFNNANDSYAGTFIGNGAGLTNAGEATFDDATWISFLSANFGSYSNWNRYGTANTYDKIRNNQGFTVLLLGDGNLPDGVGVVLYSNITTTFGLAGILSGPLPMSGGVNAMALTPVNNGYGGIDYVNAAGAAKDSTWYAPYWSITNSGAFVRISTAYPFASDNWEVDYVQSPNGGPFQIITNSGNGAGVVASLNGYAATQTGAVFKWTNSAIVPGTMSIMVTNTGVGTNAWVGVGWNNSTRSNGARVITQSTQSTSQNDLRKVPESVRAPIYASWNPSLVITYFPTFWSDPAFSVPFVSNYLATITFLRTNTPNADIVMASEVIFDSAWTPRAYMDIARTNSGNLCYFDGFGMLSISNIANIRNLFASDGRHMTEKGYEIYSGLLWNWLGLTSFSPSSSLLEVTMHGTSWEFNAPLALHTNSPPPPAAVSPGGCAFWNSNATVYLLTSTPNSTTWAATNYIAGPH